MSAVCWAYCVRRNFPWTTHHAMDGVPRRATGLSFQLAIICHQFYNFTRSDIATCARMKKKKCKDYAPSIYTAPNVQFIYERWKRLRIPANLMWMAWSERWNDGARAIYVDVRSSGDMHMVAPRHGYNFLFCIVFQIKRQKMMIHMFEIKTLITTTNEQNQKKKKERQVFPLIVLSMEEKLKSETCDVHTNKPSPS